MIVSLSLAAGFAVMLGGCGSVPVGAKSSMQADGTQLKASGAGIVRADAQNTTFRIKCRVCGYVSEEMVIPTPKAGAPYTLNWVCPNCGHKQTITISAA